MSFNAILPYFGSKRQMAYTIVETLGEHKSYLEPMCGSLAVLLSKPKCRREVVNDLHGWVINLARVVQDDELSAALFERLSRTAFCESLYRDSQAWLGYKPTGPEGRSPTERLSEAYHYFVVSWMGRNGLVGSEKELGTGFSHRNGNSGGDPATRFRNAASNIPAWWERLRGVTILNRDAFRVLDEAADEDGLCLYMDPPYITKGAKYLHDFYSEDHTRMADSLTRFQKARVVLSYYDHPLLETLYPGWRKIDVSVNRNMGHTSGKVEKAPEVLLVNR